MLGFMYIQCVFSFKDKDWISERNGDPVTPLFIKHLERQSSFWV